jgi:hypothetical protein
LLPSKPQRNKLLLSRLPLNVPPLNVLLPSNPPPNKRLHNN